MFLSRKRAVLSFGLSCLLYPSSFLFAQQTISGVINTYAHVIAIDTCRNTATVPSTAGFSVGDRVLLIQMKGAAIDSSNAPSYGTMLSLGSAGLFEIATIDSFPNPATIRFRNKILNSYDVAEGFVQLVRIPQYVNATVVDTLYPKPWNPATATGGVLILEASGTLTLQGQIDASYDGFLGGRASNNAIGDSILGYAFDASSGMGGYKGEGIASEYGTNLDAGRGASANGGGGGDAENSGGGGGANAGVGGRGGDQTDAGEYGRFANGGEPGHAITFSGLPRIFMGGGGGGGHQNDDSGSYGGNGGGIVILHARNIIATNNTIQANGGSPGEDVGKLDTAVSDGAGGGGAGGTILLEADSAYSGNIWLLVNGGDGGSVDAQNSPYRFGPGGGGGGGVYYTAPTGSGGVAFWTDPRPGKAGHVTNCTNLPASDSTYGAADGSRPVNELLSIPESSTPYNYPTVSAHSISVCRGDSVTLAATGGDSYAWSPATGMLDATSASPTVLPDSTTVYTVQMTKGNCAFTDTVHVEVLPKPIAAFSGANTVCSGGTETYFISQQAGTTYTWFVTGGTPDSGTGHIINVTWNTTGTQSISIVATNGECSDSSTQHVTVAPPISPMINASTLILANPGDTSMLSLGAAYTSYKWSTGATTSTITIDSAGVYFVTVTDSNGCSATDSIQIYSPAGLPFIELGLPDISANPGEHVILPVKIIASQNLGSQSATGFLYTIHYDRTLLTPLDPAVTSTFKNGQRCVSKHGTISNQLSTNTLDQIEFLAALGDATQTTLAFDTVIWTSGKPIATKLDSGLFTLLGVCPAGGNRLFEANGTVAINGVTPNPVSGIAVADYSLAEPGTTSVQLLDLLGRTVLTIANENATPGEYRAYFDASSVPDGMYNLVLQTPTQVLTKRVEVYH